MTEHMRLGIGKILFLAGCGLAVACAPVRPVTAPAPAAPRLPPVPEVVGELRIDVVYPGEDAQITAHDSTFVFGSVGTGEASLTINGHAVEVAPNGAWLAFLPVPADGVYRLAATARGESAEAERRVRVPEAAARLAPGRVAIVEGSVSPSGAITVVRGEPVQVRFRGTPGANAALVLPDGRRVAMLEQPVVERQTAFMREEARVRPDVAEYVGRFAAESPILGPQATDAPAVTSEEIVTGFVMPGVPTGAPVTGTTVGSPPRPRLPRGGPLVLPGRQPAQPAFVELVRGADTARAVLDATIQLLDPLRPRVGVAATDRPDSTLIGTKLPGPGNPYQWFFPNGTRLEIDGASGTSYRVRLGDALRVWVPQDQVRLLPEGTPAPRGEVGTIEVRPEAEYARVGFSMTERLPYQVEPGRDRVSITFYGASGRTGFMGYGRTDPFVDEVGWSQVTDEVYRVDIALSQPLWGVLVGWDPTGNLELRLRRPPRIDPANPLRGLRVAVDAGHPPGGAIGPTRLTEADANLFVTRRLVPMLQRAGAQVIEIRPDTATVALIDRPILALQGDAHLFVSVHFNAFPDGVNPFENHGTLVLYYWPYSLELARHLQRELLAELGLPDRGVRFQDLAIPRTTWMPAVLTETAFMMLPEVEAALRDPGVQERIAAAHYRAIESFLREAAMR